MVRNTWLLLAVLTMSFPTMALSKEPVAPTPTAHFDFKGITATTTLTQATPKLREVEAYMGTNKGGHLIDDAVNGHPADISAVFDNQGLVVMHGYPSDYVEAKAAFTIKWGKPSQVVSVPLQNGYGARIISETVIWNFIEGRMTLEDGGFHRNAAFSYESNRQIQYLENSRKVHVDF